MSNHTWPWCNACRCYGCPHFDYDEGTAVTSNNFKFFQPNTATSSPTESTHHPITESLICEECGAGDAKWCCDDKHAPLCQEHYHAMCRRMEADPIHCPLRSEMMRSQPTESRNDG